MKFVRFRHDKLTSYGFLEGDDVRPISNDPFSKFIPARESIPIKDVRLLSPCEPTKIVAVGVNYQDHAEEFHHQLPGEPILFLKPPSAIIDPNEPIQLPESSSRIDFEAELGVVIGKTASGVSTHTATDFILGYTCFNDVTARDLQKKDGQWTRAKSFNTFAPFGPCIATDLDSGNLKIESYLNGERKQSANTAQLIFGIPELISFISNVMTLFPGDVIATGTPAGVGPMKPGDVIEVSIEHIGRLVNPVK